MDGMATCKPIMTFKDMYMFCWKNGFEHNKLASFELKLNWVPQTLCSGSTWECILL